jgi:hypothetical protein
LRSSVPRPLTSVDCFRPPFPANHLGAIRSIRDGIDARRSFATLSVQNFFHKSFGMLNALSGRFLWPMSERASWLARAGEKKSHRPKTLILSVFSVGRKKSRRASRILASQRVACAARARQDARCGGDARATTLDQAKMLVFLFRCSNPKAVFAIPAGTVRHRHSLMARRAAWRRSEGR